MKNLNYHKKQVKQKQSENRFQLWANQAVDKVCQPILAASQERRDGMLKELELQRCKLEKSIKANRFCKQFDDFYGLLKIAEFLEREAAYPFL